MTEVKNFCLLLSDSGSSASLFENFYKKGQHLLPFFLSKE